MHSAIRGINLLEVEDIVTIKISGNNEVLSQLRVILEENNIKWKSDKSEAGRKSELGLTLSDVANIVAIVSAVGGIPALIISLRQLRDLREQKNETPCRIQITTQRKKVTIDIDRSTDIQKAIEAAFVDD